MKKFTVHNPAFVLLAAMLAPVAQAASLGFAYDFFEIDYVDYDTIDGYALHGSWELGPNGYLNLGYENLDEVDSAVIGTSSTEIETLQAGGGFAFAVSRNVDLHFGIAVVDQTVDNISERGFQLDGGLRARLNKLIELYGGVRHRDIEGFEEDLVNAGLRFHLTRTFHLSAAFEDADGYDGYRIGARFTF